MTQRVCDQSIFVSQTRGWSAPRVKSKTFQSVPEVRKFQNGRSAYATRSLKKTGLYGEIGPKGCLLHSSHLRKM